MAKADVVNIEGQKVGEVELNDAIWATDVKPYLIHDVVVMQLNNRRRGTAKTKTRGEVRGGGKKPWRQKGTGRARSGSIRSPLWRHGGTIFGPQPRDYSYKMPRQAWRRALCLALSERATKGKLVVAQSLELAEPKTKAAKAMLDALGLKHALILIGEGEETFLRAARNLAAHKVLHLAGLNVYDLLNYDEVLMSEPVARAVEARLRGDAR